MPRPSEQIARRYFISGRVQGVGFRNFAERAAEELGISGYVRNLADGRVEVYAIGSSDQLNQLSGLLAQGPRWANVTGIDSREEVIEARIRGFRVG